VNALSSTAIQRFAPIAAHGADGVRGRSAGLSLGIAAGMTSAAIWGGTLTMTRLGVSDGGTFEPVDIAMMRFFGPAILLLPVLWRAWPRLVRVHPLLLVLMLTGGGVPFVLVAGTGLQVSATAEAGALLPGAIPLYVSLVSVALGERLDRGRILGLGLIAIAVTVTVAPAILSGATKGWHGHAMLLAAAMLAAGYTIALRRAALGPLEAAAFVSTGSITVFGPVYLLAMEPLIFAAPLSVLILQAAYQGIISGFLAPVAFAIAVARLGASRAAAFGGLSPAAAAICGGVLLAEVPHGAILFSVIIAG
jgi:drug/metabolite transporter (DMT)-like permease